jgi:hypothetical protein
MRFDIPTILLQWSVGGLLFLWVTTRRREVGVGYGWLVRGVFITIAIGSALAGRAVAGHGVRDTLAYAVAGAAALALGVSIARRKAGVSGQRIAAAQRSERVAAMTHQNAPQTLATTRPEFDPRLDLIAPVIGGVALIVAAYDAAGTAPLLLAVWRIAAGALLLGCVTDAMLLGHWYLVQPGLGRAPIIQLNKLLALIWPFVLVGLLWPVGMVSVLNGTIDDGYQGMLGWFWIGCTIGTLALSYVTHLALKERYYSAVMAATGFLYLAIVTAFGMDLVARAVLAP